MQLKIDMTPEQQKKVDKFYSKTVKCWCGKTLDGERALLGQPGSCRANWEGWKISAICFECGSKIKNFVEHLKGNVLV
jgi:hypothetical protein